MLVNSELCLPSLLAPADKQLKARLEQAAGAEALLHICRVGFPQHALLVSVSLRRETSDGCVCVGVGRHCWHVGTACQRCPEDNKCTGGS